MNTLKIEKIKNSLTFTAKVVPNSSRVHICGIMNSMLKVKLTNPPEKGKANKELINLLAKKLKIKKNQISILSGRSSSKKKLEIKECSENALQKIIK
jgi:hypothetical protein